MNRSGSLTVKTRVLGQSNVYSQAGWVALFAAFTAVSAQIEIPHQPVPYTLQTMVVLLAGALLGKRNGALSQVAYLSLGLAGVPVFAGFGFGAAHLLGPTGGYLLSFPVAAFVVGYLLNRESGFLWSVISMTVGLVTVFSLGTIQLNLLYLHDWSQAMRSGFMIFSWWDGVKLIAAAGISYGLRRRFYKV